MTDPTHDTKRRSVRRIPLLLTAALCGLAALVGLIAAARLGALVAYADPIPPPPGYPKLTMSLKSVSPTLAHTGGVTLSYEIEIRNTGAYTAHGATLVDAVPASTTFTGHATPGLVETGRGTLAWEGDVGFDATVLLTLSVRVDSAFAGTVHNTAVLSHPLIARPVSVTAETIVTDDPILAISKRSLPALPGANKPLTYTLLVQNVGQPATGLPVTVTDQVPLDTTFREAGPDGDHDDGTVTWIRSVTLDTGEITTFTFSVDVGDVPSGTVIANQAYQVAGAGIGTAAGEPYTVTVVDPILTLNKYAWPDPPGSNREMTYTLVVRNRGSLATGLVITDRVPAGVTYVRGGSESGGIVSWSLPELDTNESARFSFTVYVSDVMGLAIVNDDYAVCTAEGVCQPGTPVSHTVLGPTFEASVALDPIAKKPGGGNTPVTPTLVVRNLGPGNALDAYVTLEFIRISVEGPDLYAAPATGTPPPFPSRKCGDKCIRFFWQGDLFVGDVITFTTVDGQNSIGGEEGTTYTATLVITDVLANAVTEPVTRTGTGIVTHYANLIPSKRAPDVVGAGQLLTYTIRVYNSALSTDVPPYPILTDVLPANVTLVSVSDGGTSHPVSETTVISWVLPALSTGAQLERSFVVRVDEDLISGTQIVNAEYGVSWEENELTDTVRSNVGLPVTTTVRELGLIDSYKEVTPVVVTPGPGQVLTYTVHIVNSSPDYLSGVQVYDWLPWEHSTYRRDAVASAGAVYSDIVSVWWEGNVAGFSEERITFTVLVDPDYEGTLVNTARISHPSLITDVVVSTDAHATVEPILHIVKSASPDPVQRGSALRYTIHVSNRGQPATELVIVDQIPAGTEYVAGSAMPASGKLEGNEMRWTMLDLGAGESRTFAFSVTVLDGSQVVNDTYTVHCAEGISAQGEPVVVQVVAGDGRGGIYLPIVLRSY